MKENPVKVKSYEFALVIVGLSQHLQSRCSFELARQVLRSGTSIGANVEEALAAQSRRDFLSKMSIASKEARECHYWLRLLRDSGLVDPGTIQPILRLSTELVSLLTSIVKTTSKTN